MFALILGYKRLDYFKSIVVGSIIRNEDSEPLEILFEYTGQSLANIVLAVV